jgi:cyanate lyase
MQRDEATQKILEAKKRAGLTFEAIAQQVGRHPVWTTAAIFGEAQMSAEEAERLVTFLELESEVAEVLQEFPLKGTHAEAVPTDPLLYRFHEINLVYGATIKALIHEKFGDGIMSAIDFELDIEKIPDPKGDRVKITYNGKFLPYRKW